MTTLKLAIEPDGRITTVYRDDLADLISQGSATISRVSHVEPAGTLWTADLSPINGPVLGPFALRETALQAELDYLNSILFTEE